MAEEKKLSDQSKADTAGETKDVTEVEIRSVLESHDDRVHVYDEVDVRPVQVSVHDERDAQVVSVTVDETLDPNDPRAVQIPREALGTLDTPLARLAAGTPQQQFDKAEADAKKK
jgi:hypothetical protein